MNQHNWIIYVEHAVELVRGKPFFASWSCELAVVDLDALRQAVDRARRTLEARHPDAFKIEHVFTRVMQPEEWDRFRRRVEPGKWTAERDRNPQSPLRLVRQLG
ncbi:MAG: hypothetical protein QNK03_25860 [Myxococcota bacterium]|nr:hypothetical protein [Myxococcota bacterium]